jgi:hypothetical protein
MHGCIRIADIPPVVGGGGRPYPDHHIRDASTLRTLEFCALSAGYALMPTLRGLTAVRFSQGHAASCFISNC